MSVDADTPFVERAQAGDVEAFEQLVERHRDRVFGLSLRILRDESEAADATQEAFLSAYRGLSDFRTDATFSTWLQRIAANAALMRVRKRKRTPAPESSLLGPSFNERGSLMDSVADWREGSEEAVLNQELRTAIQKAADSLGEMYREVFILKDLEGLSYEEIAELLGETVPAVKTRLHRARLAMRATIDEYFSEHEQ